MTNRTIRTVVTATPQPGTGILHPFPTRELPHIDPFVFLDTGSPRNLGSGDIYVGPHPHRGVQPVSLLFRGRIEHRDSLGNDRTVRSGGIQWLVAGSGALHEEVLNGDENGIFHMAQLWVNLPASLKMDPPQHHAVPADAVPEIDSLGDRTKVRLYAGELEGAVGPAPLPTPVLVGHVQMGSGGSVSIPVPAGWTAAACVVDGADAGQTVVFNDDGDSIAWRSDTATELLLMCGQPLGEPIAMGGGFVMNTETEIEAAFDEYRSGLMGQLESSR